MSATHVRLRQDRYAAAAESRLMILWPPLRVCGLCHIDSCGNIRILMSSFDLDGFVRKLAETFLP